MPLVYRAHIDRNAPSPEEETDNYTEEGFRALLAPYTVPPHLLDILVERFVYDRSFAQICEEMGYMATSTCHLHFQQAIALLKARGFSLKGRK